MITVHVSGPKGSGKSRMIRYIELLLRVFLRDQYQFAIYYSDGCITSGGHGSIRVEVDEVDK